jgi:hypothetical protein
MSEVRFEVQVGLECLAKVSWPSEREFIYFFVCADIGGRDLRLWKQLYF